MTIVFLQVEHIIIQKLDLTLNISSHVFSPPKKGDYRELPPKLKLVKPEIGFLEVVYWFVRPLN